jgi:hypothetical protein
MQNTKLAVQNQMYEQILILLGTISYLQLVLLQAGKEHYKRSRASQEV